MFRWSPCIHRHCTTTRGFRFFLRMIFRGLGIEVGFFYFSARLRCSRQPLRVSGRHLISLHSRRSFFVNVSVFVTRVHVIRKSCGFVKKKKVWFVYVCVCVCFDHEVPVCMCVCVLTMKSLCMCVLTMKSLCVCSHREWRSSLPDHPPEHQRLPDGGVALSRLGTLPATHWGPAGQRAQGGPDQLYRRTLLCGWRLGQIRQDTRRWCMFVGQGCAFCWVNVCLK